MRRGYHCLHGVNLRPKLQEAHRRLAAADGRHLGACSDSFSKHLFHYFFALKRCSSVVYYNITG